MPLTIAVSNLKGGVGKTTSAVALAALYAADRERVLVVDLDPQGSATQHLLGSSAPDGGEGLYQALGGNGSLQDFALPALHVPSVWVAPSDDRVGDASTTYQDEPAGGQLFLREAIEASEKHWDVVIIDTPPENKHLMNCALAAAHVVLVPVLLETAATRQLAKLTHRIGRMRSLNPRLTLGGIVATQVNSRRGLTNECWTDLQTTYGDLLFTSFIREDGKVAEADGHAKPITTYARATNASKDYRDVYRELRTRLEQIAQVA